MEQRRAEDRGILCWLAMRCSQGWDWIDKRDIDKHVMSWSVFVMTFYVVDWVIDFIYTHPDKPGLEVAAIVGALMVPWTPVQAAVIKWYFNARSK